MKYKKFILRFAIMLIAVATLVGSFVYIVDPLQFYRKATWYSPIYSWHERYQNPGLARNYEYDTIIIGTSMTENFLPTEVGKTLGGAQVMKLSMEGSTAIEHRMIADVAIRTGQVKRVLWGLDYFSLRQYPSDEEFPYYLYDTNPFNDYKYIFNESNIESAIDNLKNDADEESRKRKLERLNNWDKMVKYGKDRVIPFWEKASISEQGFSTNEDSLESVQNSFNTYIVSLVKAHPEIEFIFYYPPYSVLRQQVWYITNPARYDNQLAMKRYMFEQLSAFPNVSIHEFQTDSSITYNLDQYKDLSHHSGQINQLIIEQIVAGTHLVTKDNLEASIDLMRKQAENVVVNDDNTVFSIIPRVNGELVVFGDIPKTSNSIVSVSLETLSEALDAEMDYDLDNQVATLKKGDRTVVLTLSEGTAEVNGEPETLEAPLQQYKGSLYGPLKSISTMLGADVTIDESDPYLKKYNIDL